MFVLGILSNVGAQECSVATLDGDYLVTGGAQARADQADDPTYPRVVVSEWTFDGEGNQSGFATMSHGGQIIYRQPTTATYTLDSDCVGVLTFAAGPQWHLVVTKDGSEGAALRIDVDEMGRGSIATRAFKKR